MQFTDSTQQKQNIPRKLTVNQNYYKTKINLNYICTTHRCDIWAPSRKSMLPERLFTFIKVGVSNILQLQCNTTIMSQQMSISSFIVREDQQSFYSLHFDFHNYTVAAALGPEIFLRRLRNKHNYCPSAALSLSLTLHLQPNFDVEAYGTACNSTD